MDIKLINVRMQATRLTADTNVTHTTKPIRVRGSERFECINQRRNNYTLSWQVGIRNCHLHRSRGERGEMLQMGGKNGVRGGKGTVELIKGLR